jgi:F-type H+-transporting ATPase subunit a
MSDANAPLTMSQYIHHHLHNWQFNLHNATFTSTGGFWTLDLDTVSVSLVLGVAFLLFFYLIAKKATISIPKKTQNAIEMVIEGIGKIVKESCRDNQQFVAALALTVMVWVFLMNFMDLIPVDLLPMMMKSMGVHYFRSVPTADPSLTFALSLVVFILVIFYNVKSKGFFGLSKEMLSKPFGWYLFPINLLQRLVEECVKPVSLSLRLFGNLLAGEIVFLLIATMPWWVEFPLGFVWTMFHLLVIVIQSFIFMMLTIVYCGLAQESH